MSAEKEESGLSEETESMETLLPEYWWAYTPLLYNGWSCIQSLKGEIVIVILFVFYKVWISFVQNLHP